MHSLKSIYSSALKANGRRATWWLTALMGAIALSLATPALGEASRSAREHPPHRWRRTRTTTNAPGTSPRQGGTEGGEETPVQYEFKCNGQITGYQLQTQLPVTGIEGAPLVTNYQGTPLKDTFSCGGTFPGYAVNCVGASTTEANEQSRGSSTIGWKLCTEPRVDPLLTVTYAYLEKGVITQAISGPFDLGRPEGCPATAQSGKDRLDAYQGKEPKPKKKHKKGKKKDGKSKKAAELTHRPGGGGRTRARPPPGGEACGHGGHTGRSTAKANVGARRPANANVDTRRPAKASVDARRPRVRGGAPGLRLERLGGVHDDHAYRSHGADLEQLPRRGAGRDRSGRRQGLPGVRDRQDRRRGKSNA